MNTVLYYIMYALLGLVALLPLRVLYVFSNIVYFILFYVVRYRRNVTRKNLDETFPNKTPAERLEIEQKFYRNFADYIFETIKLLHISDKQISQRMRFENTELIDSLLEQGKSIVVYFSHCGNWEWAPSITLHTSAGPDIVYTQVYRPLRNKVFDRLMLKVRSRFGSVSIPKSQTLRRLIHYKNDGKLTVNGFMSDQKQSHGDPTVVTTFLGRPTAFISGTETLARKLKFAAVYWDMQKPARGHYKLVAHLLDDGTYATPRGRLTLDYAAMLEKTIQRQPSIWLWTHKRWKYPIVLSQDEQQQID